MSRIPFVKAHACGNDFLIIEESLAHNKHSAMARKLCSRNTGIGADGIEFLDRRENGTLFLRLFNADGSEAELSGNGTRCVAAWLAASEDLQQVSLRTHGGVRACRLLRRDDVDYWIESGMGTPRVMLRTIEISGVHSPIPGAMVNVGNPHYVLFPAHDDFSSHGLSWQELGAIIAIDPLFPFGTNVEFVRVLSPTEIAFRIFERGCGPTTSSGTGTCASSAAAMVLRNTSRELSAIAQGGTQQVVWPTNDSEMFLTGPAEIICTGEVDFG
ncbi:MAG TPA: diaminopimelate epimerase [Acidobacteriaceae bacterium]